VTVINKQVTSLIRDKKPARKGNEAKEDSNFASPRLSADLVASKSSEKVLFVESSPPSMPEIDQEQIKNLKASFER